MTLTGDRPAGHPRVISPPPTPREAVLRRRAPAIAPWLHTPGLIVATVLFVLGAVATLGVSYASDHFLAPWPTLVVVLLIVAALVIVALRLPRADKAAQDPGHDTRPAPSAWIVFALTLPAGS